MTRSEKANIDKFMDIYTYTSDIMNYLLKNEKMEIKYISDLEKKSEDYKTNIIFSKKSGEYIGI